MLVIKSSKPPFDDINVRKAFVHAIDYDLVVETLLADAPAQLPVYQILPPTFDCYQEKRPWTYDPELARQELADSKYGGPENLPAINVRYWQKDILPAKIAQLYQQMWSQNLGVNVNLHQMSAWNAEFEKTVQVGRVSDGYLRSESHRVYQVLRAVRGAGHVRRRGRRNLREPVPRL